MGKDLEEKGVGKLSKEIRKGGKHGQISQRVNWIQVLSGLFKQTQTQRNNSSKKTDNGREGKLLGRDRLERTVKNSCLAELKKLNKGQGGTIPSSLVNQRELGTGQTFIKEVHWLGL